MERFLFFFFKVNSTEGLERWQKGKWLVVYSEILLFTLDIIRTYDDLYCTLFSLLC